MNGGEAFAMFRSFADESDKTFLTDAQVTEYLKQGHKEYRNLVTGIDPGIFLKTVALNASGKSIDLTATTPVLAGAAALPANKLDRLVRVARINTVSQDDLIEYLVPAPNEQAVPLWGYCFTGDKIIFGGSTVAPYRIEYIPTFDYAPGGVTVFGTGSTGYIDDLEAFHIIIILLALQYYAVRDGASSDQINGQLAVRRRELERFLMEGRHTSGHQYVLDTDFNY